MRKILRAVILTMAFAPLLAAAQTYPDKSVKMIVPYPAGGPADQIARELANGLSQALGQTFVIETKGGGSGSIGTAYVAKAAPDGYTLLASAGAPHTAVPVFSSNPPYDGIKEFSPILMIIDVPNVMVIGPHIKVTNVKEFIELAKTKVMTYGSSGTEAQRISPARFFKLKRKSK
jgi:tripartite-type tricarboxylate transporter receptor subunit TctC